MTTTADAERDDLARTAQLEATVEQARIKLEQLESDYEAAVTDPGVIDEDRSAIKVLLEKGRAHHRSAQNALDRHLSGTYGKCQKCGDAIAPERLEALPDASLCRSCSA